MPLYTTVRIDEEVDTEIDDDEVVEYVLETSDVLARVLAANHDLGHTAWAEAFADSDYVQQEQMIEELRRLCPTIHIEWKR